MRGIGILVVVAFTILGATSPTFSAGSNSDSANARAYSSGSYYGAIVATKRDARSSCASTCLQSGALGCRRTSSRSFKCSGFFRSKLLEDRTWITQCKWKIKWVFYGSDAFESYPTKNRSYRCFIEPSSL